MEGQVQLKRDKDSVWIEITFDDEFLTIAPDKAERLALNLQRCSRLHKKFREVEKQTYYGKPLSF